MLHIDIETLQFQSSLIIYTFNKYKRKSNPLKYNYIDNSNTVNGNFSYPLFCINTGNNKDYKDISFIKSRLVMEYLFPVPTEYEIYNSSIVPDRALEIINILKDELTALENQKKIDDIDQENYENDKIKEDFTKCRNQIEMYIVENSVYNKKSKKTKLELDICRKDMEKYGKKLNKLKIRVEKYLKIKKVKDDLDNILKNNEQNQKTINEYKIIHNNYLTEITNINRRDIILYIIIYIELIIIIFVVVLIGIYHPLRKKYYNKNSFNDLFSNGSNFRRIAKKENKEKLKLFDEMEMGIIK
jgi:hypothetical protein